MRRAAPISTEFDELGEDFLTYLRTRWSASSIKAFNRLLRDMLTYVRPFDDQQAFADYHGSLQPGSTRTTFRVAWRIFCDYGEEKGLFPAPLDIPNPRGGRRRKGSRIASWWEGYLTVVPEAVEEDIGALAAFAILHRKENKTRRKARAYPSPKALGAVRWEHVNIRGDSVRLNTVLDRNPLSYYRKYPTAQAAIVKRLRKWATPEGEQHPPPRTPLVPMRKGGSTPMTAGHMRHLAKKYIKENGGG